jgi:hypothetical protein
MNITPDLALWARLELEIGEIRSICYDMLQEIKKMKTGKNRIDAEKWTKGIPFYCIDCKAMVYVPHQCSKKQGE